MVNLCSERQQPYLAIKRTSQEDSSTFYCFYDLKILINISFISQRKIAAMDDKAFSEHSTNWKLNCAVPRAPIEKLSNTIQGAKKQETTALTC